MRYGLRPSSLRVGVSTPCMTVSAGVTSWWRRGSGCVRTRVRPGWIVSPWSRWRITAWTACCVSCVVTSARACIARRRRVGWRSRNHEVVSGRWGFPRCGTGWPRRRPRSCWNRSSRRTSCRARMGFGRSGRPRKRWSGFASASSRATRLWWSLISPISSARSTTTGYSLRWVGGSRIGGCSNCCVSGCRQE